MWHHGPVRFSTVATAATLVLGMAAPLGLATPVHAATEVVTDPSGDTLGGGVRLDVTRAALANDDRVVVARVAFAEDVRGDLIVSVDPRGATGARMVARKKRDGGDYGAVRFSVPTENSSDSDVAPDGGSSGWIPRG